VVCYTDTTIALPILAAFALSVRSPRKQKRLYDRRAEMLEKLASDFRSKPKKAN
jgi:deoxyhypusine synthase